MREPARWGHDALLTEPRDGTPGWGAARRGVVALDATGRPDFHLLRSRMLHWRDGVEVTFFVFDVLAVDGHPTMMNSYAERRALLEELDLELGTVRLVATFEDGEALFAAVCERMS
jgi:bifunctional non-homologous end joining protein LigD